MSLLVHGDEHHRRECGGCPRGHRIDRVVCRFVSSSSAKRRERERRLRVGFSGAHTGSDIAVVRADHVLGLHFHRIRHGGAIDILHWTWMAGSHGVMVCVPERTRRRPVSSGGSGGVTESLYSRTESYPIDRVLRECHSGADHVVVDVHEPTRGVWFDIQRRDDRIRTRHVLHRGGDCGRAPPSQTLRMVIGVYYNSIDVCRASR